MVSTSDTTKLVSSSRIIIVLLSVLVLFTVGYVITIAKGILIPFALAVFINYMLYPSIEFFNRKRVPNFLSILITMFISLGVLVLVVHLISGSIASFSADFPKYEPKMHRISQNVESFLNLPANILPGSNDKDNATIASTVLKNFSVGSFVSAVINSISSILSNTFLILLILLFMLFGRKQVEKKILVAFNQKTSEKLGKIIHNINLQIQKYIVAKTIISLITGGLFVTILSIFGVEFVVIWGIFAFILNFIPNIGSLIATILPLFVAFLQFDDPIIVLWIAVLLVIVQQVMGNIVEPKWLGKKVNLSPLVILFSLVLWGWVWGIIGMFLSVPITVIIKIILENIESTKPIAIMMGGIKAKG